MYPNPQDVLPLPSRPDVEQYRTRAKELVRAQAAGGDAIDVWATEWVTALGAERRTAVGDEEFGQARAVTGRDVERQAAPIANFARQRLTEPKGQLSQARFVIARAHGFSSWPAFVRHVQGLSQARSGTSAFERAVDAIVRGDLATLDELLAHDPALVHARSPRSHRATLLHYVSANGVENYRQRTPGNIVDLTRRLLDAGADVNAEADVYGGGATTLGLVVTSAHPRAAGVQLALADLLLSRGARMDPGIVHDCLMNGCPEAAAHLAARGAPVPFDAAAGIGRLDLIAARYEPTRSVSTDEEARALITAAWYDQGEVVCSLVAHGVAVATRHPTDGETALHIAAYRGNEGLVELLLALGAPVNVVDGAYRTPPVVWALHALLGERRTPAESYRAVVRRLVRAGAEVQREWLDGEPWEGEELLRGELMGG